MNVLDIDEIEALYKRAESLVPAKDLPLELKLALFELGLAARKVQIQLLKIGLKK